MKKNDFKENKKRGASEVNSSTKLPPVNPKQAVPSNFTLNAVSNQDQGLISILHQYFIKNNYLDTLESFQKDCCKQTKVSNKNQDQIKKQLLSLFDKGERIPFFIKFGQFVPISMRTKDMQTMRIQFYLELYFFIYSIHPSLGKKKTPDQQSKKMFIDYLQSNRGGTLSKSKEFLQYYPLTNIQKPQDHPVYKNLFTKQWVVEFRKRIAYFFEKLYPSDKTPTLIVMYDRFIDFLEKQSQVFPTEQEQELQILEEIQEENNEMNPEPVLLQNPNQSQGRPVRQLINKNESQSEYIQILKANNEQLQQEKDNLFLHLEGQKIKYQKLQNTYKDFSEEAQKIILQSQTKWFQITQQIYAITDEILSVCKKLRQGVPLSEPDIIDKISLKLSKYQRFMKMKIQEIIQGQNFDFSVFASDGQDNSVMQNRVGKPGKLIQLDFNKIRSHLSQPETANGGQTNNALWQSKILLLQALKWRISRAKSAIAKRQAIISYTIYDVLGLLNNEDNTILTLLNSQNSDLVEQTIALINALTKDYYGRDYVVCQKVYKRIIELFVGTKISYQSKIQLIFSLQICSTKKLAQQLMIRYDMIKIIIKKIQNQRETIQPHYLQYLVALLMNILLNKEGPKKAEEIKGEIMMTLINLIQCENMGVRSLIHGSLYPLLCHKAFREKAKQFGLLQNIKFLLQNSKDEQHQHQLIYLKEKLQKDEDEPHEERQGEEEEDNNDPDEFFSDEYQQDFDDYAEIFINGIKGQELLMKQYVLLGPQSLDQRNTIHEKVGQTLKRKELMDNSFYQRQSVNTPIINNKFRRNISNNNSVYSNKSSNRILKSQMNSRSQIGTNHNIPNVPKILKEKLDTVHQNNSQVSLNEPKVGMQANLEDTFRKPAEQPIINGNSSQMQKIPEVKVYENTEEYKNIFQTRAKLVRTPPRK